MEKLEGYKTVVFFALALLIAVANMFGFGDFQMSADQEEIALVVVSVVGLILRFVTKSAVFSSSAKG